jgi:hypothetical protein
MVTGRVYHEALSSPYAATYIPQVIEKQFEIAIIDHQVEIVLV